MILNFFQYMGRDIFCFGEVNGELKIFNDCSRAVDFCHRTGSDFIILNDSYNFPDIPGKRILDIRIMNWYLGFPMKFEEVEIEKVTENSLNDYIWVQKGFVEEYKDYINNSIIVTEKIRGIMKKFVSDFDQSLYLIWKEKNQVSTALKDQEEMDFLKKLNRNRPKLLNRFQEIKCREFGIGVVKSGIFGTDVKLVSFTIDADHEIDTVSRYPIFPMRISQGIDSPILVRNSEICRFISEEDVRVYGMCEGKYIMDIRGEIKGKYGLTITMEDI